LEAAEITPKTIGVSKVPRNYVNAFSLKLPDNSPIINDKGINLHKAPSQDLPWGLPTESWWSRSNGYLRCANHAAEADITKRTMLPDDAKHKEGMIVHAMVQCKSTW